MNNPKLSIIILIYNTNPQFLKECIQSIQNQSFEDYEIICLDDGSKDNYHWVKALDPRIVYHRNDKNLGIPKSSNKGLEYARGEYITRVDSDDTIDPSLFEKEINFLDNNPDYQAICCNLLKYGLRSNIIKRPLKFNFFDGLYKPHGYGYASGFMFRSSVLQYGIRYDEKYFICEDYDFHLQILQIGKIHSLQEILYFYRRHSESTMMNSDKKIRQNIIQDIQNKHFIMKYGDKPLVSVILTLHDISFQYLKECLNTLDSQTFKWFKIIVVDDASSYSYDFLKQRKNVIFVKNPQNLGVSKSVNIAFDLVDTKYCVRLGSDDIFDSKLLEKEVKYLEENPNSIAVCTDIQQFGTKKNKIIRPDDWNVSEWLKTITPESLHKRDFGYAGGMMFRSHVLKSLRLDTRFNMCEDLDFHIGLAKLGEVGVIHEPLYFYRKHQSQITSNIKRERRLEIIKTILSKHKEGN